MFTKKKKSSRQQRICEQLIWIQLRARGSVSFSSMDLENRAQKTKKEKQTKEREGKREKERERERSKEEEGEKKDSGGCERRV